MKTFAYSGYRSEGGSVHGLVEALDPKDAREQLLQQGIFTRDIEDAASQNRTRKAVDLSVQIRAEIFREWAILLKAGHSLHQCMELLLESPEYRKQHSAISRVRDRVQEGEPLSHILADVSTRWRPFEQAILEVGERSGKLSQCLFTVADYLEEEIELREKSMTAVLYPLCVIGVAVLIVGISCTWLLPSFQGKLQDAGLTIPGWTELLIAFGRWGSMGILLLSALAMLFYRRARSSVESSPQFLMKIELVLMRIPGLNEYTEAMYTTRYCQSLAVLLESGVALPEACAFAGQASGSTQISSRSEWIEERIRQGDSFAQIIRQVPWLKNRLPGWLRAGEESGSLANVIGQAAERSFRRAERMRERFLKLLEPALIVVMGGLVMLLAFGLLSPILSMNDLLSQ